MGILVSAVFWTWLWGPLGLVLATPMTVCIVVLGRHVPQLEFFTVLLSDEAVLEPGAHYYQRLLAEDHDEASELVEKHLVGKPLVEVYDAGAPTRACVRRAGFTSRPARRRQTVLRI